MSAMVAARLAGSGRSTRSLSCGGGEFCEAPHFVCLVAGQLHIVMSDGSEFDLKQGDVATIPAGHDGWVVGDKPVTMLDFGGVAKPF